MRDRRVFLGNKTGNARLYILKKVKFQRMFQNPISGAVKYCDRPDGGISISCGEIDNGLEINLEYHDKFLVFLQSSGLKR